MRNGFKELEEEALSNAPEPPRHAQERIISQLGRYKAWTSIVDHFISSPIQLIRKMMYNEPIGESPTDRKPPSLGPKEE